MFSLEREDPGGGSTDSSAMAKQDRVVVTPAEMDRVAGSSKYIGSDSVTSKSFLSKMMASRRRSIVDLT